MKLFILLLTSSLLFSQATGVVTVTSNVTATAGTGTSAVTCVFSNPSPPAVRTLCSVGGATVLTQDATPAVGATTGAIGSFANATNTVTWQIQQPTAGSITWAVAANGVSRSGSF
jgi:hypothetical protein